MKRTEPDLAALIQRAFRMRKLREEDSDMPRGHRPSRTDGNHAEVMLALRAAGWSVASLHMVGGILDQIAAKDGFTMLVECKLPGEELTEAESKFVKTWNGKWAIVHSGQDAVTKCEALRESARYWGPR